MKNDWAISSLASNLRHAASVTLLRASAKVLLEHSVVLFSFALSRLTLLSIGLLTEANVRPITVHSNKLQFNSHQALNIWGSWDTGWYVDLAVNGYQQTPGIGGQANWAFFPAYPAIAKTVALATGMTAFEAMLLISNITFVAALLLIHRLASLEFDKRTADLTVVLLCVAPGSYIFSAAYTESLFLLCLTGGLLLIRSRKWVTAGMVTAAAVLTRNLGVGLLLPYAWEAARPLLLRVGGVQKALSSKSELVRISLGGLAPVLALVGFMLYLQSITGDALAFVHVQKAWGRSVNNPFSAMLAGLVYPSQLPTADWIGFVEAWVAMGLIVKLTLMRRPILLMLALFLTLVPLAAGLASFTRYALVIVPLWLVLANHLAKRPRATIAVLAMFAMLNGFMMVAWSLGLKVTI